MVEVSEEERGEMGRDVIGSAGSDEMEPVYEDGVEAVDRQKPIGWVMTKNMLRD